MNSTLFFVYLYFVFTFTIFEKACEEGRQTHIYSSAHWLCEFQGKNKHTSSLCREKGEPLLIFERYHQIDCLHKTRNQTAVSLVSFLLCWCWCWCWFLLVLVSALPSPAAAPFFPFSTHAFPVSRHDLRAPKEIILTIYPPPTPPNPNTTLSQQHHHHYHHTSHQPPIQPRQPHPRLSIIAFLPRPFASCSYSFVLLFSFFSVWAVSPITSPWLRMQTPLHPEATRFLKTRHQQTLPQRLLSLHVQRKTNSPM